ncbi:MAG: hypothetical protein C4523_02030 [Myxococcales bacterium]|nr:MAG: hypothetical protein C4523_02030 [Myxococcales bacterium]
MKVVTARGNNYRLSGQLNPFQEDLQIHLIDWKWKNLTPDPGQFRGEEYDALLPDSMAGAFAHIYPPIHAELKRHHQGNPFRIHKFFDHMASSQAANINLFLPILMSPNASAILGALRPDLKSIAKNELDHGCCVEFWGENFSRRQRTAGPLNDKSKVAGTDADLAIAYVNRDGELCLWLIEHKLTEAEFTTCGGFRSPGRKARHDCGRTFSAILKNKNTCYYHDVNRYRYWEITEQNQTFFKNHGSYGSCPFRNGMNQLWRNQLLAVGIEQDPQSPFKHVHFSVVKHPGNHHLDKTVAEYRRLIGNNPKFTVFTSADVINAAQQVNDPSLAAWIQWYKDLYRI